jgi:autotransporter-associated beta strand protein
LTVSPTDGVSSTFSGSIKPGVSGIALQKYGNGTLVLAGSSTYVGGTTIAAGTLVVSNTSGSATGSSTVTLTGGTLASGPVGTITGPVVAGAGAHVLAPGGVGTIGTLNLGSLSLNNNSTLDFDINGTSHDSLVVGGSLAITGTANIYLSTTSLSGSYTLATFPLGTASANSFTLLDPPANYTLKVDPTDLMLVPNAVATYSGTSTWTSLVSGSWSTSSNWDVRQPLNPAEMAVFAGSLNSTIAVSLDGPQTAGGLTFANSNAATSGNTGYAITPGNGGSLLLSNTGGLPVQVTVLSGSHSISAPVTLASNLVVNPVAGSTFVVSGNVTENTPGMSVSLTNAGTLILAGSNGYTGGTNIAVGSLQLGNAAALGNGNVALTSGGTLDMHGFGPTLTALAGDTTGVITDSSTGGTTTVLSVNVNSALGSTYNGAIVDGTSQHVGLNLTGTGMLTLGGTNTYTGGTTVTSGTLWIATASAQPMGGALVIGAPIGAVSPDAPAIASSELIAPAADESTASSATAPVVLASAPSPVVAGGAPGIVAVPEPGTLALLLVGGLVGVPVLLRRRKIGGKAEG